MSESLHLLIADNHTLTFWGISSVLDASRYIVLPFPTASLRQTQQVCQVTRPDVLLLALSLARPLPEKTVLYFRHHHPPMRLILLDDDRGGTPDDFLLKMGVHGYLRRADPPDAWRACFQAIACGAVFFSQPAEPEPPHNPETQAAIMSKREHQLLQLLLQGHTNKEIADQLGLSESTVRNNLSNLYKKMGINKRTSIPYWLMDEASLENEDGA